MKNKNNVLYVKMKYWVNKDIQTIEINILNIATFG